MHLARTLFTTYDQYCPYEIYSVLDIYQRLISATITHRNVITGKTEGREWISYTRSVHFLERSGDNWLVISNAGQPLNDEGILLYMEQEWNDASKAGDVAWFERNYAGDAADISSRTGVVHSKAEEIASMRNNKGVLDSLELSDLNVRVEANAAIVTGINRVKGRDAKGQTFDRKTKAALSSKVALSAALVSELREK